MTLAAKVEKAVDDKAMLDVLNAEAKKLDKRTLLVAPEFHTDLQTKLEEINAHGGDLYLMYRTYQIKMFLNCWSSWLPLLKLFQDTRIVTLKMVFLMLCLQCSLI